MGKKHDAKTIERIVTPTPNNVVGANSARIKTALKTTNGHLWAQINTN